MSHEYLAVDVISGTRTKISNKAGYTTSVLTCDNLIDVFDVDIEVEYNDGNIGSVRKSVGNFNYTVTTSGLSEGSNKIEFIPTISGGYDVVYTENGDVERVLVGGHVVLA